MVVLAQIGAVKICSVTPNSKVNWSLELATEAKAAQILEGLCIVSNRNTYSPKYFLCNLHALAQLLKLKSERIQCLTSGAGPTYPVSGSRSQISFAFPLFSMSRSVESRVGAWKKWNLVVEETYNAFIY